MCPMVLQNLPAQTTSPIATASLFLLLSQVTFRRLMLPHGSILNVELPIARMHLGAIAMFSHSGRGKVPGAK